MFLPLFFSVLLKEETIHLCAIVHEYCRSLHILISEKAKTSYILFLESFILDVWISVFAIVEKKPFIVLCLESDELILELIMAAWLLNRGKAFY